MQNTAGRIFRVERNAVVGLHDARIVDAIVGAFNSNVPTGFLHDDAQDGAHVNARFPRYGFDGLLDEADLAIAVVKLHQSYIARPQARVLLPLAPIREVRSWAAVLDVPTAALGTSVATGNVSIAGWGIALLGGEFDHLADLEACWVNAWVCSLERLERYSMIFGDFGKGIASFDGVCAHDDLSGLGDADGSLEG